MCVLVAQLCLTLCDPVVHGLPGSSVHGILQARILKWVAIAFSRGSSNLGIEPAFPGPPALEGRFLTTKPPGKALRISYSPDISQNMF